jgi:glutathione S-transferase
MTYQLLIGQRGHSSWSLRGWLPFAVFGIDVAIHATRIYSDEFAAEVAAFGGAGTVPVVRTPEGGLLTDSIAIAWHLAEAFPDRGLLPTDPQDRAEAISLIAEMHSGFTALRGTCPMNLYTGWAGLRRRRPRFGRSRPDRRDLVPRARPFGRAVPLRELHARGCLLRPRRDPDRDLWPVGVGNGAGLCPHPPGAARFPPLARHGAGRGAGTEAIRHAAARAPFPAAPTLSAWPVETGTPENAACPYSGKPVTHLAEIGGRVFGFCNAFCRDKTVADPEAWPAFMEIYDS